jgi:hypothetical protein
MKNAAAISAQLVDVRNVGQHKCVKLTLHVPAEQAGMVMAAFGWPTQVDPVPVAIARLNPENVKEVMPTGPILAGRPTSENRRDTQSREEVMPDKPEHGTHKTSPASGPDIPARAHKPVAVEKRLAQRAGILCADLEFQKFLHKTYQWPVIDEKSAIVVLRHLCQVKSRSEIKPGTQAGYTFDLLNSRFVVWRDADKYVEASA